MKHTYLFLVFLLFLSCRNNHPINQNSSNFELSEVNVSEFSEVLKEFKDFKAIQSLKYKDSYGTHYLIITHLPKRTVTNHPDYPGTEIQEEAIAILFLNEKKQKIAEKMIKETAPFDLFVKYIPEATEIIDVDEDKLAEIFLLVEHVARTDISPSNLSVIAFSIGKIFHKKGRKRLIFSKGHPMEKDFPNGIGGEVDDSGIKEAPEKVAIKMNQIYQKYYKEDFEKHFQLN